MKKTTPKTLWLLPLMLFLGCASIAPKVYTFENKNTVDYPFDMVWNAVIETFAERNIPVDNMEKVSGYISTREMRFQSEWADCGKDGFFQTSDSQPLGSFNIFVKEVTPKNCTAMVNATFRVSTQFMDEPSSYKNCNSTGEMELWFYETLLEKLSSSN